MFTGDIKAVITPGMVELGSEQERLNREFKRRSDAIQVFPNPESILRLMGAVAIEQNDALSAIRRVFTEKVYSRLKIDCLPKLKAIAANQRALLTAA